VLSSIYLFDVLGFNLSPDHVLRESLVCLDPGFLDGFGKVVLQGRFECVYQRIAHDGKHLRLDTVTHVLDSELGHNLGQQLDIGTQHVQGRVDHLNKVSGVHDETLALKKLGRMRINIDRESEEDFGLWALFEKTESAKEGKTWWICCNALPGISDQSTTHR
jgi:hypothetical protein